MIAYFSGLSLGLSLILAIGAQNAFVLKQGLLKQHVFLVCLICALSDALLILMGVTGFSAVIQQWDWVTTAARYTGAVFLTCYGLKSWWSALFSKQQLKPDEHQAVSLKKTLLTCLAFTWLNPHVYLDTLFLIGSVSTQYPETLNMFAAGAMTGSFLFFFSLGYGARLLIPIFSQPVAWKWLDGLIGGLMLWIAWSLVK